MRRVHRLWRDLRLPIDLVVLTGAGRRGGRRLRDAGAPVTLPAATLSPEQRDLLDAAAGSS